MKYWKVRIKKYICVLFLSYIYRFHANSIICSLSTKIIQWPFWFLWNIKFTLINEGVNLHYHFLILLFSLTSLLFDMTNSLSLGSDHLPFCVPYHSLFQYNFLFPNTSKFIVECLQSLHKHHFAYLLWVVVCQ